MSRALALKVGRAWDPGAGGWNRDSFYVVPAAVVSAILDREFHSIVVSRRYRAETVRETPAILGSAPAEVRGHRVLDVVERDPADSRRRTCGWAVAAIGINAGASQVRTAVCFKTGSFETDFHALATQSTIVLPWDREVLVDGELVPNPMYEGA